MGFKRVINCVETHDGEPMRVVTGGIGPIPATASMKWKNIYASTAMGCGNSYCANRAAIRPCAATSLYRRRILPQQQDSSLWNRRNIR